MTVAAPRRVASDGVGWFLAGVHGTLVRRWGRAAQLSGLHRLVAVVSLDCDTDEDARVVESVHERLAAVGVTPAYAVPGEQLERDPEPYRRVAATGAEFLNHGWRRHCELEPRSRTYQSSHFYDRLATADVERDVRRGHEAQVEILGRAPVGFRTPHFGTFDRRADIDRLHALLQPLGYRYSTSTGPRRALLSGPIRRTEAGLWELAVSGTPGAPHRVLDTWSFRFAPGRRGREQRYLDEVRRLLSTHVKSGLPGLINLYGDPSQVDDWPEWFDVMGELAPYAARSFAELVDELG